MTEYFPFGVTPEFMLDEVQAISSTFGKVTIVPRYPRSGRDGPKWPLPENVALDLSLARMLNPRFGRRGDWWGVQLRRVREQFSGTSRQRRDLWPDEGSKGWAWRKLEALALAEYATTLKWARLRQAPDLSYTFWLGSWTAALGEAWPGIPLVSRAHGYDLYSEANGLASLPMQREAAQASTLIALISRQGLDYLSGSYPELSEKMEVHYLGSEDPGGMSNRSTDGIIRVWSVSNVVPVKRVPLIAASLCEVARTTPVHWTHIGGGSGLRQVRQVLKSKPSELSVSLLGSRSHTDVLSRLRKGPADVFVNASASEGLPVSLMEAQSMGIPTVATDVGGVTELLEPTLDHLVVDSVEAKELGRAIALAALSPPTAAVERRERWQQRFDAKDNAGTFAQRLLSLREGR